MKIGLDIDGVILNTENEIRVRSELYDLLELHKKGTITPEGFLEEERYDWTKEEVIDFRKKYLIEASKATSLMPGAKQIIELLQKEGHELIIITTRGLSVKEMKQAGLDKLEEYHLTFDKYFWEQESKLDICKQEKVDIMIDDKPTICKNISANKIRTLYFRDVNREKLEENEYLKEVNNWGEVYRYIYNLNMEEK
ncbi:MAG: hypothetical protein HFJ27_01760 [Clostridia bacterium]|nr:hypothetical protein [Clostridia bacterium]